MSNCVFSTAKAAACGAGLRVWLAECDVEFAECDVEFAEYDVEFAECDVVNFCSYKM